MELSYKELRTYELCPERFYFELLQYQQQFFEGMGDKPLPLEDSLKLAVGQVANNHLSYEDAVEEVAKTATIGIHRHILLTQLNNIGVNDKNLPGTKGINTPFKLDISTDPLSDLSFIGEVDVMGNEPSDGRAFFVVIKSANPYQPRATHEARLIAEGAMNLLGADSIDCLMCFGSTSLKNTTIDCFTREDTQQSIDWSSGLASSLRDDLISVNMGEELSSAFPPKQNPLCSSCPKSECSLTKTQKESVC